MNANKTASSDMTLREMGSFFIGGEGVRTSGQEARDYTLARNGVPVRINPNGTNIVGGMYAQFFRPVGGEKRPPISFWHGGSLTGATWESTPDGREGWVSYFTRQGWDTYNVDAVERGRSGWAPLDPHFSDAPFLRTAEDCFTQFRIGTAVADVAPESLRQAAYPDCRFPLDHFTQFARQVVPRWASTDDLAVRAYVAFLRRIGGSIIVAHSQGAAFAFRVAERAPELVKAIIAIEPAQGGEGDGSALSGIPVLLVYGDHLARDARWPTIRARTDDYMAAAARNGAAIDCIDLPAQGVRGNSHMLMLEDNNLEIALLVRQWLAKHHFDAA